MAKKDIDLRKLFVPVKLRTKVNSERKPTTDVAYLRSAKDVDGIPPEKRRKSLSDFALSNHAWQSETLVTENGKLTGAVLLRNAYVDFSISVGGFARGQRGFVDDINDTTVGLSVSLDLDLKSLISAQEESRHVKITARQSKDGTLQHFVELGEYVGSIASPDIQEALESAYNGGKLQQGLTCTGRLYTTNGQRESDADFLSKQNPEFEFNGEKYVRVVVWNDASNHYSDGTITPQTGTVVWHKVEPVELEIKNWDELPRSINPGGRILGGAKIIKTETEQCVLSGIPFYPCWNGNGRLLWQNSLIRAFLNSAKSSQLDGDPDSRARLQWDFSKSGFLYQAFDMTRQPTLEYAIAETEQEIADYAFAGCVGIEKIHIPSHVTKIGRQAFSGCVNSQIVFENPNERLWLDPEALMGTDFKFVYLSKDGTTMTLSSKEDPLLEKTCFKRDLKSKDVSNFFKNNYRENFVKLNSWRESGKIKFIPPEYTMQVFPSSEMEKYFLNNNHKRWGKLVKALGFDTLEGSVKNNSLVDLMKIYYALGGFSQNQGESERAFEYVLKYVAVTKNPQATPIQIANEIHARFSKLSLKGPFNPDFAKFFMKYYHKNPDFMNFRLLDKDGDLMDSQDYLCAAHNAFDRIQKTYPNRVVNGNEERALLSPRFVAEHCSFIEYEDVKEGNEVLADIVAKYGYDQESFDHIQEVYEQAKKIKDKYVIRADKASGKNGISFRILEKDDPLGFVLGDITNCCQHIGGAGEECVDDGYENPNAGFLVFEESVLDELGKPTGEIRVLGQAYVWYDPVSKTVCYDNIEIPTKILDELRKGDRHDERLSSKHLMDAVIESADAIMTAMNKKGVKVDRVTTGQGYNDLGNELEQRFGAPEKHPRAQHQGYSGYSDARSAQYVIRTYDETTRLYADTIRQVGGDIEKDLKIIENGVKNAPEA